MRCRLEAHSDGIAVRTPYDRHFVEELKQAIPSHERRWDRPAKLWLVHPKHGQQVQRLCYRYFDESPNIPQVNLTIKRKRGTIKLLYVGACKEREDGTYTSFGLHFETREWSVVFPDDVLRNWFDGLDLNDDNDQVSGSYYLVLGIKHKTDDQAEIKSAYRRMARQWHPDICKEPDAEDRFKTINEAYDLLSDPRQKKLYDLGQSMMDSSRETKIQRNYHYKLWSQDYKPALRCGVIDCDYEVIMGRAFIRKVYKWDDIVDEHGRTLVTSWLMGDTEPTVMWV